MTRLTHTGRAVVGAMLTLLTALAGLGAIEWELRVEPQDRRLPAFVLRMHSHEYGPEEEIPWAASD